jgi:hypothetical protein
MIHTLPLPNNWNKHCRYHYPKAFFIELAEMCNYRVLDLEIKNALNPPLPGRDMIFVAFCKDNNDDFISRKSFKKLKIITTKDFTFYINSNSSYVKLYIKILRFLQYGLIPLLPAKNFFRKIFRAFFIFYLHFRRKIFQTVFY